MIIEVTMIEERLNQNHIQRYIKLKTKLNGKFENHKKLIKL